MKTSTTNIGIKGIGIYYILINRKKLKYKLTSIYNYKMR